jgi:hypothetical protein
MSTIIYLLLAIPTVTHLLFDYTKKYTGGKIRHWLSALIVVILSFGLGFFDPLVSFWQFGFYALGIHFAFFDILWNWVNGHKWHYNGDRTNPERAWTDKMWDFVPVYAQPLIRFIGFYIGYGFYYHLEWIL